MNFDFEERFSRLNLKEKIIHYHSGSQSPALESFEDYVQKSEEKKKLEYKKIQDRLRKKSKTVKVKKLHIDTPEFENQFSLPPITQRSDLVNVSVDFDLPMKKKKRNLNQVSFDQIIDLIGPEVEVSPTFVYNVEEKKKIPTIASFQSPSTTILQTELKDSIINTSYATESIQNSTQTLNQQQILDFKLRAFIKYQRIFKPSFNWNQSRLRFESEDMLQYEKLEEEKQQELRELSLNKKKRLSEDKPFKLENRKEKTQNNLLENIEKVIDEVQIQNLTENQIEKISFFRFLEKNQIELFSNIIYRKLPEIQQQIYQMLEICQEIKDLKIFTILIYYLGEISFDLQSYNEATFFSKQCLIISEFSRNYELKSKSLLLLSHCARKFKQYQQSKQLIKKALLYAWVGNNNDIEVECYDLMGLTYFYLGDVQQAIFYHEKWTLAETEPRNGYFHETARAFVNFYERYLGYNTNQLTKTLMMRLQLPILNKLDPIYIQKEDSTEIIYKKCDEHRLIKLQDADGRTIIDQLLNGIEFVQFNLDYYEIGKRAKNIKQISDIGEKRIKIRVPQPKRIMEIKAKYQKKQKNILNHDIYNNPNLIPNLEMKINYRLNQQRSNEVNNLNEHFIKQNKYSGGQKQEQIYVRHIQQKFLKPESHEMYYARHHLFFNNLVHKLLNQ